MLRTEILELSRALGSNGLQRVPGVNPLSEDGSITCIACNGALSFLPYSYPFTFGCDQGHFLTLQALFDAFLLQDEQLPGLSALECWERKATLLRLLAQRALEVGHVLTAADFQEVASRIDHWVSTLRSMIPHDDSEAILAD